MKLQPLYRVDISTHGMRTHWTDAPTTAKSAPVLTTWEVRAPHARGARARALELAREHATRAQYDLPDEGDIGTVTKC